ncbi:acylneuraminate cytidylyltransferase family protein [Anaerosacchariphilus polymeriproducens]|uniref:Acylneuraminate cytidylyltransferase family protein n=1 Tax=Anaerosacchariphilus polymeriproducens TaxID=1812858 RepID=A0A371AQR8_9FIRM|nr:acylneuraminate cytidylyltransferase family protein [Anaerosacchariphilus polymeriproducens]RDU21872.1 acylneuraminate cytidylyltransferase family protein [Anaerosacchariphilus polymeriproducens]
MKNLAIIPARSGSKGLKDKNIKEMNGMPLLVYSIQAALESNLFDTIYLSTDSEEYAKVGKAYGAQVPFLRPKELASDTASSWDAVRCALKQYETIGKKFDTVSLLQPTSPLRTKEDIIGGYELYQKENAQAVIGVCEVEHSPLWSNTLPESKKMDDFIKPENDKRRQELNTYYRINGALYIVDRNRIMETDQIYKKDCYAFIMEQSHSIDIDTELDFEIAQIILKNKF